MKQLGLITVATATPEVRIAHPEANRKNIEELAQKAYEQEVNILVFPELSLTGATCGDLFFQPFLLKNALEQCNQLAADSLNWPGLLLFVGLPISYKNRIYNCAAAIKDGTVLALIPQTFLADSGKQRYFTSGKNLPQDTCPLIQIGMQAVPLGQCLIDFSLGETSVPVGAEIGSDLWSPIPPCTRLACEGAQVIVNLAADPEIIGSSKYRRDFVVQQSARLNTAYLYAGAASSESTTDSVFSGHSLIAENGQLLAEQSPFSGSDVALLLTVIDLELLANSRQHNFTFAQIPQQDSLPVIPAGKTLNSTRSQHALRPLNPLPFIPQDKKERDRLCREVLAIQAHGLARRLKHIHSRACVIGISGGLDSTLALLAIREAYRLNHWPLDQIVGVTMPGFGTTDHTYTNAMLLMQEMGLTIREISIRESVTQHLKDIEHPLDQHDITYENSQARERTQILMDIANQMGGLVIGTGDLSELCLGWCTYNGDQMSMYGINAGVPKTLLRHIVQYVAEHEENPTIAKVLESIVETPISPELLPPKENGLIAQHTEDSTGPYELHDFFIYHSLKHHYSPEKIYALAVRAFSYDGLDSSETNKQLSHGYYDAPTILKWLRTFYRRFIQQQFKRSAMPDGPKIGSIGLSPREDLKMPSDAETALWLDILDKI